MAHDRYEALLRYVRDASPDDAVALGELAREARRRGEWRGELVALLCGEPTPPAWQAICDLLEAASDAELAACLGHVQRLLEARWPWRLRTLRVGWLLDWRDRGDAQRVQLARVARLPDLSELELVCAAPVFAGLRELVIEHSTWPDWYVVERERPTLLEMLEGATSLRGLERLSLGRRAGLPHGAAVGETLSRFASLTHLAVPMCEASLCALGDHPRLRVLDLRGELTNAYGRYLVSAPSEAFVETPLWRRLEGLGLRGCVVTREHVELLTRHATRLRVLDLSHTRVDAADVRALLASRNLGHLETLRVALSGDQRKRRAELAAIHDPRLVLDDAVPEWLGDGRCVLRSRR